MARQKVCEHLFGPMDVRYYRMFRAYLGLNAGEMQSSVAEFCPAIKEWSLQKFTNAVSANNPLTTIDHRNLQVGLLGFLKHEFPPSTDPTPEGCHCGPFTYIINDIEAHIYPESTINKVDEHPYGRPKSNIHILSPIFHMKLHEYFGNKHVKHAYRSLELRGVVSESRFYTIFRYQDPCGSTAEARCFERALVVYASVSGRDRDQELLSRAARFYLTPEFKEDRLVDSGVPV